MLWSCRRGLYWTVLTGCSRSSCAPSLFVLAVIVIVLVNVHLPGSRLRIFLAVLLRAIKDGLHRWNLLWRKSVRVMSHFRWMIILACSFCVLSSDLGRAASVMITRRRRCRSILRTRVAGRFVKLRASLFVRHLLGRTSAFGLPLTRPLHCGRRSFIADTFSSR